MSVEYAGLKSSVTGKGWTFRSLFRTFLILGMSIPVLSLQFLMVRLSKKYWWSFAGVWHRLACRITGLKIHEIGTPPTNKATLYVSNHISWVDILVLGGILKNASFVAKSEIAGWGMIGSVCALQKTLFINRSRRSDSVKQRDELTNRVKEGNSLILFPEGTSTDGMQVAPFKSSLFSVAEMANHDLDESLCIQPVTLSYTEVNGMPLVRSQKPWVAWIGDMELLLHLKQFFGKAKIVATVEYHPPILLEEVGSRKNAAQISEKAVREGLERAHRAEYSMGKRSHDIENP